MAIYTNWAEMRKVEYKPVWACAYELCDNKKSMKLSQKTVRGMITGTVFYPLKKNSDTEIIRSRGVYCGSRKYADTYEECVVLYNALVQKRIEWFEERIKETKEDFIKVENQ